MWITKCDTCKKEIKDTKAMIKIGYGGYLATKELCFNCGKKLLSKLGQKEIIRQQ